MRITTSNDGIRVLETGKGAVLFHQDHAIAVHKNDHVCCVRAGHSELPSISDFADGRSMLFANECALEARVSEVLY